MEQQVLVRENAYYDSVTLMSIGNQIGQMEGIEEAVVVMATAMNREILQKVGLANTETDQAGVNDLVMAVRAVDKAHAEAAVRKVEELLNQRSVGKAEEKEVLLHSIRQAAAMEPERNMAVISVPGAYAAREAEVALNHGMHVMLFSDNVSIEEEKRLKELAVQKHLLMMGPDCGTAVLNGTGFCFANSLRRGDIGVIGASGTGIQEVLVQIHRAGGGISQAIGTGGRDLCEEIGGRMMLEAIRFLKEDPETRVLVLVSKPPHPTVEEKIYKALETVGKPVVICFLEGEKREVLPSDTYFCSTLAEAGALAAALSGKRGDAIGEAGPGWVRPGTALSGAAGLAAAVPGAALSEAARPEKPGQEDGMWEAALAEKLKSRLGKGRNCLKGLFCGGTLCAEALMLLRSCLPEIRSNISHRPAEQVTGKEPWTGNILMDLGEDEFTNGKPHPMLEPSLRSRYIQEQMKAPETGVLLVDVELGWGSHPDPAGQLLEALRDCPRDVIVIGYLLGTGQDYQGYEEQKEKLEKAGIVLMPSNAAAARLAGRILKEVQG